MNSFRYCFVNQPILVCEIWLRKPDTRPVYENIWFANFANWNRSVHLILYSYYLYNFFYWYSISLLDYPVFPILYFIFSITYAVILFLFWKGKMKYTAVPVCEVRKLGHFVNRTCVRVPKQGFANQYWLVYEAITKWIHSVSEGVIDHRKKLLIITILLHLNNIYLREIYIALLFIIIYLPNLKLWNKRKY